MEIYISIDGVLRNTIAKFDYHYKDHYLDSSLYIQLPKMHPINGIHHHLRIRYMYY